MNLQFLIILGFIILSAIIYVLFLQEKETFDNRKNKVIVCFFGVVPRSIKYTFSSIQNRLLNKLKQYWGELRDENKTKIWKYLETLIKLADLIM